MKLCDVVKMKIEGDYNWSDFSEHYYCQNCRKIHHVYAKATGALTEHIAEMKRDGVFWQYCPDCLESLTKITDDMIKASKFAKAGKPLRFTPEERKEIFDDWKKHIKSIPTMDTILQRKKRAKRTSRTLATV